MTMAHILGISVREKATESVAWELVKRGRRKGASNPALRPEELLAASQRDGKVAGIRNTRAEASTRHGVTLMTLRREERRDDDKQAR